MLSWVNYYLASNNYDTHGFRSPPMSHIYIASIIKGLMDTRKIIILANVRYNQSTRKQSAFEVEHAFTHAHSVKWTCDRAAAEIEKMRRYYLELPVHGGKKNSSPPSLPPKKQLSIANFARSVIRQRELSNDVRIIRTTKTQTSLTIRCNQR